MLEERTSAQRAVQNCKLGPAADNIKATRAHLNLQISLLAEQEMTLTFEDAPTPAQSG